MKRLSFLFLVAFLSATIIHAQTIGTLLNSEDAYDGYTLFNAGPGNAGGPGGGGNNGAYLVNNCGELINSWLSDNTVALSSKLMHDGSLVRGMNFGGNNTLSGGGSGGGVEILGWEGNLLWQYNYNSNAQYLQHHDIMPLPNGNILVLAWESRSSAESSALGRQDGANMKSERIVEVTPNYTDGTSGTIVWEWYAFDHTVQNVDASLGNFGDLLTYSHKFNINNGNANDWLHFNALEYMEEYDQIAISSRFWDEMFVIDHSTTTAEAATGSGGNYGKGGDILYRWGRPSNYNGVGNQTLQDNHGVRYAPTSYDNGGTFSIFSNGGGGNGESTIVSWTSPINADGSYTKEASGSWGPANADVEYPVPLAQTGSSCQPQPNGNLMYCANSGGNLGEIDLSENLVWQYKIPLNSAGPVAQGGNSGSSSFNAERYSSEYPGLADKDLTPGAHIELNPIIGACMLFPDVVVIDPPSAAFTTLLDEATVTFTDSSSGENITEWLWDFGDGNTSTEQNPTYTYAATGTYSVCLTVTNAGGSNTICEDVSVIINSVETITDLGIHCYPNPATNKLYIESPIDTYTLELLDISGQRILSLDSKSFLDVSGLAKGLYLLNIITEKGTQSERIIIR